MTSQSTGDPEARTQAEAGDQSAYPFSYGHGRMPFFMKVVWIGFLIFATWYVVEFLLDALGREI